MSKTVRIKKGFDINLAGKAENTVVDTIISETVAIKPTDFIGFSKPKLLVKEGDTVKAGTPLYYDKSMEKVMYTSPVSGKVALIKRGNKRKLEEIRITADKSMSYESFKSHSSSELNSLSKEEIIDNITKSGIWSSFIQRPYAIVANPEETPSSIHISTFDTSPLAPDSAILYKGEDESFKTGVQILKKLTSGSVNINVDADEELASMFSKIQQVEINKFKGVHPAGCVGVQIHHVSPIAKGDLVWTISPYAVIQIGKLFGEGKYDASKIIAVVGSEIAKPQYYKTYAGACVKQFLENNLKEDHVRVISGNVLTGTKIEKDGYLGYYDNMVSVIPEGDNLKFFGSFVPTKRLSFHRALGLFSFLDRLKDEKPEYVVDTNINGEHRNFVQTGAFEKVLPMDIYPTYLLKAIMAEDYENMEALGILEVAEEDFALCEFIDPSKTEVQSVIRQGIELMRNS
ncbi:MAG: Na(+)-translocating NADH-quinone reductase subunit A [Cyclobacteriaceae bacterium]